MTNESSGGKLKFTNPNLTYQAESLGDTLPVIEAANATFSEISIDKLTGLENQNALEKVKISFNPDRLRNPLYIFKIDLNRLKYTNDNYGSKSGDNLLIRTANLLNTTFRQSDHIYRAGGDEFIVLCETNSQNQKEDPIDIIINRMNNNNEIQNSTLNKEEQLSFAIGAAKFDRHQHANLAAVIKDAEDKMYENKAKMKAEDPTLAREYIKPL